MTFILGLPRSRLLSSALACLFACGVALTSNATASEPKAQPGQSSAQLVTGPANASTVRYTDWRTAPRHSAELLPDPVLHRDRAMVFVLAARAFRWRGHFAVHPWVVFKREGEESYTRYEVMGWGGGNVVRKNRSVADGLWFGAPPRSWFRMKGKKRVTSFLKLKRL